MPRKQTGELTPTQIKHRNAKERDGKFRDFIQRQDVKEEAALLKKSKRIGHMKERFENETGYKIPLSMVYKNINKVYPKKVTEDDGEKKEYNAVNNSGSDEKESKPEHLDEAAELLLASSEAAEEECIEVPISDSSDSDLQIV